MASIQYNDVKSINNGNGGDELKCNINGTHRDHDENQYLSLIKTIIDTGNLKFVNIIGN